VTAGAVLGPQERRNALERMRQEEFDVVIIGGGVNGAGAALDAATRGLSVALVESSDFAAGTSSGSSKLVHGGLRYLEQRNFNLVREALRERGLLLERICPHLAHAVPFLFPLLKRGWQRPYIGAGMVLYDNMGGRSAKVPGHKHFSKKGALKLAPGLKKDYLIGGIQYYDGQIDDARHTVAVARTAAMYGAALATSTRMTGLERDGERVRAVQVQDLETGDAFSIRTRCVVGALGVWTPMLGDLIGKPAEPKVTASKGIHFLVPRDRFESDTGLILQTEKSVLFVIPWGKNHWVIGTTDTPWKLDPAHTAATQEDIDYLLDHVNEVFERPLTHDDIEGVFVGLRPLVSAHDQAETTQVSREHMIGRPLENLVTIAGGKYTTYRVMAEDVIDAAAKTLGGSVSPSVTAETPLVGADGYQALRNSASRLAADHGLTVDQIEHLLGRYGSEITTLFELIAAEPELGQPIPGAGEYLRVEARFATTHEGALHLDDTLRRRTRIYFETKDRGVEASRPVAEDMAGVLGWDEERIEREVSHYRSRIDAERAAQGRPDDEGAERAVAEGPELRLTAGVA
jgi:glycerol-3-phosphate dehydrogenase